MVPPGRKNSSRTAISARQTPGLYGGDLNAHVLAEAEPIHGHGGLHFLECREWWWHGWASN